MVFWIVLVGIVAIFGIGALFGGPPFVPTLKRDLVKLFDELNIGSKDHLVDLGAGDGRVMLLALQRGARASGVEISWPLVMFARFRLRKYHKRHNLQVGNLLKYNLPDDTTHIFLFTANNMVRTIENYLIKNRKSNKKVTVISYGYELEKLGSAKRVGAFNIYQL